MTSAPIFRPAVLAWSLLGCLSTVSVAIALEHVDERRLPYGIAEPLDPRGPLPANAERFVRENAERATVYWDSKLDTPRYISVSGTLLLAQGMTATSSPEREAIDAALRFLDENADFFGMDRRDVGRVEARPISGGRWLVLVNQTAGDVAIRGALMRFVLRADGTLVSVKAYVIRERPVGVTVPEVDAQIVVQLGLEHGLQVLGFRPQFVFSDGDPEAATAIWSYDTLSAEGLPGEVLVSFDGEFLEQRGEWFDFSGSVRGFYPDPDSGNANFFFQTPGEMPDENEQPHGVGQVMVYDGKWTVISDELGDYVLPVDAATNPLVDLQLNAAVCRTEQVLDENGALIPICAGPVRDAHFLTWVSPATSGCRVEGIDPIRKSLGLGEHIGWTFNTEMDVGMSARLMAFRHVRRFLSHINDRKRNAGIDVDEEAASLAIVIPDGQAGRSQEYQFRYYPSERRPTLCAPSFFESNINGVWQRQWLTPTILAHEIAHHAIFEITGYRASHRISCFRDSEVDRFRCRALVEDARPETRGISVVEGITDALAAYYTATPKFGYSNLGLDRGPMAYDISIDDESQPDVIRRRLALALWRMREEFERHARESRRVTVDEARSNLEFLLYRLLERNRCLVETDQMLEAGPCLLQELLDVDRDRNDSEFEDAIRLAFDGSLFARSRFTRGDVNEDGRVDISDVIVTLEFLFRSQGSLCLDAVDANDSGQADLADPIYVLLHLFQAGPAVPPPGDCGLDNTEDELFCTSFGACDAAE